MGIGEGKGMHEVLPMNILENEILCRLPVKPLLRCKSVCKLWYSVIKSPSFISNHYHHQSNRYRPIFVDNSIMPSDQQLLPILKPGAPESLPIVNLEDSNGEEVGANLLSSSYYVGLPWIAIFVRPVNGFLLMLFPNRCADRCLMAMFNPATREFRQLCDFGFNTLWGSPPECPPYPTWNHIFGYGICSDPNPNPNAHPHLYKVVWLNVRPEQRDVGNPVAKGEFTVGDFGNTVAKVFTIGGDGDGDGDGDSGWRMINVDLPRRFVMQYSNYPEYNITMNGKCYWLSRSFAHILVFDMNEEVFREMKSPVPTRYQCLEFSHNKKAFDAVFSEMPCCGGGDEGGNSLALFVFESHSVDISVMAKEEGWHWIRRIVTFIDRPISDLSNPLVQFQLPFPITDAIIFKSEISSFASYNPKTDGCVNFRRQSSLCLYAHISILNFKESLFSMDGGIQVSDRVLQDFNIY